MNRDRDSRRTKKILVVDDDPAQRRLLIRGLSTRGFACSEAGNVQDALRIVRGQGGIDLVVSDLEMPGGSGVDLTQVIQEMHFGLPVLVVTGVRDPARLREVIAAGAVACVQKPYRLPDFLASVERLLAKS